MAKVHVKKNDNVFVLTGKDAGKTGKVLEVDPAATEFIVEGVSMSVKQKKPRGRNQQGGIIHQESSVHASNVMVVCDKCKRRPRSERKFSPTARKYAYVSHAEKIVGTIKSPKQR
jgi:large subunit ribosomal protein L24